MDKIQPLKNKLRFKDEDDLQQYACDVIFKCSGEQPTENNLVGCEGCDAQEKWVEKNYSDMVIDESNEKQFASKRSIKSAVEWLKEKCEITEIKVSGLENNLIKRLGRHYLISDKLINEAFYDVMEKVKNNGE